MTPNEGLIRLYLLVLKQRGLIVGRNFALPWLLKVWSAELQYVGGPVGNAGSQAPHVPPQPESAL